MDQDKKASVIVDKAAATMLLQLLTQASAQGPNAKTLAGLYDDVKAAAESLGVVTGA
jgi:hypothetical protein